jgi:hypothetical protein
MTTNATPTLRPLKSFLVRVSRETLNGLQHEFSDSGYTNADYGDIIIDLALLLHEDRGEFAARLGINKDELPDEGLILAHI